MVTSFKLSMLPQQEQSLVDYTSLNTFDQGYLDSLLMQSEDDKALWGCWKEQVEQNKLQEFASFFPPIDFNCIDFDSDGSSLSQDTGSREESLSRECTTAIEEGLLICNDELKQYPDNEDCIENASKQVCNRAAHQYCIKIENLRKSIKNNNLKERKYACKICDKRFKRPSSLSTHMNIHTGKKPFSCPSPHCGKSFNARSNMLRHFKLHFKLSRGVYMLPNGEVTTKKPSSRNLLLYLDHFSAMERQKC